MRFSIITPTFRRAHLLSRAVQSVQAQTYQDWEMIIVNDSPFDKDYEPFASSINDARIHYRPNESNRGVNYSRNKALTLLTTYSKYVIFLDDDDYLAPDALQTIHDLIMQDGDRKWLITNRALVSGVPVTTFPKPDRSYSYALDYLLLRRGKGDATHCIEKKLATRATFSTHIKQGEEWLYFFQIGLQSRMYYHDHNSTISDGYDAHNGLNFRKRTRGERFETISTLLYEGYTLSLTKNITFIIYILARYIKLLLLR